MVFSFPRGSLTPAFRDFLVAEGIAGTLHCSPAGAFGAGGGGGGRCGGGRGADRGGALGNLLLFLPPVNRVLGTAFHLGAVLFLTCKSRSLGQVTFKVSFC